MKKALGIMAGVVCSALAAYWLIGVHAKTLLAENLAWMHAQSGMYMRLVSETRSIFSSSYLILTPLAAPKTETAASANGPKWFPFLRIKVAHGPFPLNVGDVTPCLANCEITPAFDEIAENTVERLLKDAPGLRKLSLSARIGFSGDIRTVFKIPPMDDRIVLKNGETLRLESEVIEMDFLVGSAFSSQNLATNVPWLRVSSPAGVFEIRALSGDHHSNLEGKNLYPGEGFISIEHLSLELLKNSEKSFCIENLRFSGRLERRKDILNSFAAFSGEAWNNGYGKVALAFNTSLENQNFAASDDLVGQIRNINMEPFSPAEKVQKALASLTQNAGPMLAKSPRFNLKNFTLTLPSGSLKVEGFASYAYDGTTPRTLPDLLRNITAELLIDCDEKSLLIVAEKAAENKGFPVGEAAKEQGRAMIAQMLKGGLIHREGERLSSKISWNYGNIAVNNIVVPQHP